MTNPPPPPGAPPPPPGGPGVPPPPPPGPPPGSPPGFGAPPGYGAPPPGYATPPPGYGAPGGLAPEPSPQQDGLPLAGFGARLGAFLLDGLLYGLVTAPFVAAGVALMVASFDCIDFGDRVECELSSGGGATFGLGIVLIVVGSLLAAFLYVRAMGRTGQTWGAKIVGVKVVRRGSGETIGFGAALGRSLFAYFLSGSICYLGYLWMLWDRDKQTWQDKVVSTVVVRVPGR